MPRQASTKIAARQVSWIAFFAQERHPHAHSCLLAPNGGRVDSSRAPPLRWVPCFFVTLFATTMIGAYRDYRVTGQKQMLLLTTAGVIASVTLLLSMAWIASIGAQTR